MLDESITSSPSKSNKSIHKVRLLRKNKRKKLDEKPDHKNETNVDKILFDFYKDSEEDELDDALKKDTNNTFIISKPSAIIENYKPFEMEKSIAMADRLSSKQDDRDKIEFPENQGFYTCQTMKENDMLANIGLTKPESSFLITESELINCCHQAEKVFEEKEPALHTQEVKLVNSLQNEISLSSLNMEIGTPNQEMALVNSILEDFSQSPLTKEQHVIYESWQHTPEFRLRRKPIKTYSRKCLNRTGINLNKRLESLTPDDDDADDDNSNCSSISIQEDFAPLEGEYNGVVTDTSQRLCQNLLNLSAFFSQNSSTNSSQDLNNPNYSETFLTSGRSQERLLNNIFNIIHEILKLQSTSADKLPMDSYSSNQDFCGFPSQEEDDNALDMVIENDHVQLNKTSIDPILPLEEQKMDISLEVNNEDYNIWIDDGCEDVLATINTNAMLSQNINSKSDPSQNLSSNMKETVSELVSIKSPEIVKKYDERILTNECLNQPKNSTMFMGFKTASSKTIKVSRNAHIVAAKILSKLPDIPIKSKINNCDQIIKKDSTTTKEVNIFENPDDYEWNDDCDFFMNFKTPAVLKQSQHNEEIFKEKISSTNDFPSTSKMAMKANIGFQTALGKNIAISQKAQASVQRLLKEIDTDFKVYKDFNELSEMKMQIYAKSRKTKETYLQNIEEYKSNSQFNENTRNIIEDKESNDKISQKGISKTIVNENMGFKTAQGKNIKISVKAQQSVEQLLKDIVMDSNENFERDLAEIKHKINQRIRKPITANNNDCGTNVCATSEYSNNIEIQRTTTNNEQSVEVTNKSKHEKSNDDDIEPQHQNSSKILLNENIGFQTALGKKITVTQKAQQCAEKLLKEFNTDLKENIIENLETMKNDINSRRETKQNSKEIYNNNEDFSNMILSEWPLSNHKIISNLEQKLDETKSLSENKEFPIIVSDSNFSKNCNITNKKISSNIGFQTAKGNKVVISEKAQKAVDNLLQEFRSDLNTTYDEQSLMDMKSKIEMKNKKLKQINNINLKQKIDEPKSSPENKEFPIVVSEYNSSKNCEKVHKELSSNICFQTAKGNQVSISAKAQKAVDKLLQEFKSDINTIYDEQSLMDMKAKIEMKNIKLKQINNINLDLKSTQTENSNLIFSEWPLNDQKDLTPKQIMGKRKLSLYNSDIPSPITTRSPPCKIIKAKSSLETKTPLNSSPIATTLIARKNLLSLTKRRKNKRNLVTNISQDEKVIPKIYKELVATPIKFSIKTSLVETPATPNLKEFFSNAPQTSTPREEKNPTKSPYKTMDGDFKPINWDNNDSTNNKSKLINANFSTKLSDSTCSNISFNSSNPTAKERIGRLKMYGKPPAVSPILIETHNSCRPSGLRRTRSMLKKSEDN